MVLMLSSPNPRIVAAKERRERKDQTERPDRFLALFAFSCG
jgi:hypothetical protein